MTVEPTRPNAARIYDCFLGGDHNYPVDQAAAQELAQLVPELPQAARLYRYFVQWASRELAQAGFTCYLDLASGLPTEGYIHELVPPTARIIYNDIDPETIAYAEEIVRPYPNVRCILSDLRDTAALLAEADDVFEGERRVGICMVGVSYFLSDAELTAVLRDLAAWAAPGSWLAINVPTPAPAFEEQAARIRDFYARIGQPLYARTEEQVLQLAPDWQPVVPFQLIESFAEQGLGHLRLPLVPSEAVRGQMGIGGILARISPA